MKLKRSDALARASVTDRELRRLEDEGMVVPSRSWKTLWMIPYYDREQVDVIQWLASCQRTIDHVRDQENRQIVADQTVGSH
jgi:hypothetical protein